jgi:CheY-like chemotaxis protein
MKAFKILIVDDHPINLLFAKTVLTREGHHVITAANGFEALAVLEKEAFDAVLLDISLPEMSGDEVCRRLRAINRFAQLPIIAYTAHAHEDERQSIMAAGFDAIVTKPVSSANLCEVIANAVALRTGKAG